MIKISKTNLQSVLVIKPEVFEDLRGEFIETYNEELCRKEGIEIKFIQDDISVSTKNVLRGIHGDNQTWKLISCLYGKLYFVVVNCDKDSEEFGKWQSFILSDKNRLQVLVPPKYGNAHLVLSEKAIFHYKQSTYYNPKAQFSYKWNDPKFKIWWPIKNPITSQRDETTSTGNYIQMDKNLLIRIEKSIELKQKILADQEILYNIEKIIEEMEQAFRNDKKVLFCGNGGSAADAQHLAAELSGKFYLDREPLFAEALHVNPSYLTAAANDLSYDEVFSRILKAKGREGDVLVAISTSGNSTNVIKAIETANALKIPTVGLTGKDGGRMKGLCKYLIKVPSDDTPRIQESHILIGHIICEMVEKNIFGKMTSQ